eukprot:CAMPEP_0175355314 /NCGR_PEP_ID=MMETSP0095-20121207/13407_1 /TAXON_ID=311494 /ORGANISM="Alexandrium monilatum, Strain CCMP3105" /LENGTH=109 /DNA_ID=CAMNT_0016652985 /DNA_START=95 /DNA_END=420 /DNA_ORIENTATION=+
MEHHPLPCCAHRIGWSNHELDNDLKHAHTEISYIVDQLRKRRDEPEPLGHKAEAATSRRESGRRRSRDAGAVIEGLRHEIAALRDRQGELEASIPRAIDALRADMSALR